MKRALAAMENTSLPSDVIGDEVTTSKDAIQTLYYAPLGHIALRIIYFIIGTVGVIDNVFVIVVFALFIKITDKVYWRSR